MMTNQIDVPEIKKHKKYLFVSNVDLKNRRGGWDGLGGKIFDLLTEKFTIVRLLDKVNPPIPFYSKVRSKLCRKIGIKANFPAFSYQRLQRIAGILKRQVHPDTNYVVFHGSTPWVCYHPTVQYCAILDCSFVTYMQVYHDINKYGRRLINKVRDAEKVFFENADQIFFTSDFALQETRRLYALSGENFTVIGQGPSTNLEVDLRTIDVPGNQFLFIGTDFLGKGGAEICNSFQRFSEIHPDYELVIVGQRPPEHFLKAKNVRFVGYINKSTTAGEKQLQDLYLQSKALLIVTRKDIAPLVVIEAGMLGCPAIANDFSALNEMVKHGKTGFLVNGTDQQIFEAMVKFATMPDNELLRMRSETKKFMEENFSWEQIIRKMIMSMSKM